MWALESHIMEYAWPSMYYRVVLADGKTNGGGKNRICIYEHTAFLPQQEVILSERNVFPF